MCEAMRTLMKDDIVKAQEDGKMEQARETAYELYDEDGFSPEKIAKRIKVSVDTVQKWLDERLAYTGNYGWSERYFYGSRGFVRIMKFLIRFWVWPDFSGKWEHGPKTKNA